MSANPDQIFRPSLLATFIVGVTWFIVMGYAVPGDSRVLDVLALLAAIGLGQMLAVTLGWWRGQPTNLLASIMSLSRGKRIFVCVALGVALTRLAWHAPSLLGFVQDWGLTLALFGLPILGAMGGHISAGAANRRETAFARNADSVATIFGVPVGVVITQCGLREAGGGLVISPVAPDLLPKAVPEEARVRIDAQVATVMPHLEISEANQSRIVFSPVSPETQARRSALQASGGLLAGEVPSVSYEPYEAPQAGPLVISAEDLR